MFSIPVLGRALDGLSYARALCAETRRLGRVDLIDAHFEYPDGVGAYLAARRLGVPVVVTLRGKLVSLAASASRRPQIQAMLRGADALIAVSASLAALARQVAGRDLRVDVIPNGVDSALFHPVDRAAARAAIGWEPDASYALCVGHYQRVKGFDRLLAAWPAVRARNPHARLVLVGSRRGERGFHRGIQQSLVSAGLQNCVSLLDPVDAATLNLMYAAANLSVNASRSEGWCNAIAESLAAGTPVVAGDIQALAGAISAALARDWDRPLIAARGAARDWDQVAREVNAVFERALGGHSASRIPARQSAPFSPAPAAGGAA
jgi:glycosyltransferase involved in cell wall biosynthesis